jgi:hypothetical protein
MALRKFILAGVPEQVNIPILLGLEHHLFRKYGVELEYKIVPEVHSLFMIPLIFFVVPSSRCLFIIIVSFLLLLT